MRKRRRHKYEYKVNPSSAGARIARIVGNGLKVLELGPGPGAITRLLHDNGNRITAVELDCSAIEIVRPYCDSVVQGDLNDPDWPLMLASGGKFDVIVAGDVLEHLYEPWVLLQKLHSLLNDGGALVVSLPHIAHNALISSLLGSDFEYQPWGLLDKTHVRFFGLRNIQALFNDAGFKIVDAEFVMKSPEQTEFARHWRRLPKETQELLKANRFGNVYQVVVRAVPRETPGEGLMLLDLATRDAAGVGAGIGPRRSLVVQWVVSRLSLGTRERIGRLLDRVAIWR